MIDLAFQRRVSERSALLAITLSLLLLALSGCGSDRRSAANTPSAPIARIEVSAGLTSESRTLSRPNAVMGRKYELITPTGERIMAAALQWQVDQEIRANAASYAQPAQCARNISKVLALAGLDRYQSPLVPQLVQQIRSNGGFVRRFPKSRQAIASLIATEFNGRLPTGALIAGCLYESCGGNAGDGHVAVVGDIGDGEVAGHEGIDQRREGDEQGQEGAGGRPLAGAGQQRPTRPGRRQGGLGERQDKGETEGEGAQFDDHAPSCLE